jgi:DNA-directed RNA polymerase specialized sigma subunit
MSETRKTDIELWNRWKATRSAADLEALMKQMMPIIKRETMRWSSVASSFVLENQAKQIAIEAFNTYNPAAGALLSTHLTARLQKLSRTGYQSQSTLSVPEHQRLTFNKYRAAVVHLEDINGRKPELHDVADYLAISPKKLQSIVETVGTRELIESGDGPEFVQYIPDDILDLAVSEMTPVQKQIFSYRTGYDGQPKLNATQIMSRLTLTQGQLSYQLSQIKALLKRAQQLR